VSDSCVFCEIVTGRSPANVVYAWLDAVAFRPLNPVTQGHVLVVPRVHVEDAFTDSVITGTTYIRAAEYAAGKGACNLITSVGKNATQTVFHLHVHVVPRRAGDGLPLPWTPQQAVDVQHMHVDRPVLHSRRGVDR
jgi:histidine triad (HIT) family protein